MRRLIKGAADARAALLLVGATVLLLGCAQAPKPLYHWESYERQLYEHFKAGDGTDLQAQFDAMEISAQKASASGSALPPGFRAHMALLCLKLGRDAEAQQYLLAEKERFPESVPYMDFLLTQMQRVSQ